MDDKVGPDLSHPDALIRLTSTVLRFRCPSISWKAAKDVNFLSSFHTVGTHVATQKVLKTANSSRDYLIKALSKRKNVPHTTIATAAEKYETPIHQILLACRVQPESARLDQRLIFEWSTGIEEKERYFKSEAIMYELVMTVATQAVAIAGVGTDECIAGQFASASRNFKKSSGIFDFLATSLLPQWMSKGGKVVDEALPAEAKIGVCEAFKVLMLGIAQQMAVATVLMKDGTPNWSLLAKLSLGISEQFQEFVTIMRTKASTTKSRMDPEFFTLMTFQIEAQKSFSLYFNARHYWEKELEYGLAIAMMNHARSLLVTRDSAVGKGLPEIKAKSPLKAIEKDLNYVRSHMQMVLNAWEKDNSTIYFDKVPLKLPAEKTLAQGVHMMKADPFELEVVEPVALILPGDDADFGNNPNNNKSSGGSSNDSAGLAYGGGDTIDSDYELAKRLQEQLNSE
mmetsp:Transcript_17178/g.32521  ORF Transcript_17178/g.32521 Transcript_17178/m.32521 type:complete len:455 (+) Transcript_17178:105-1469(+)